MLSKASWLWSSKAEIRIIQVFSLLVWNAFFWILPFHLVWLFNDKILTPLSVLISLEHSFQRGIHWRNIRSLKIWFRLWLRDCCQLFAKCFSIIHSSLNMETHCLNIAWENVLWCLVKPKVVYLNTLNFSFSLHKYIQCHPFVSTKCFKITFIEICRYLICHSVGLSYLCCFSVCNFSTHFCFLWFDKTVSTVLLSVPVAKMLEGQRRQLMVDSKERSMREPMELKDQLFPGCRELQFPSWAPYLQRGGDTPGHLGFWGSLGRWGQDFG